MKRPNRLQVAPFTYRVESREGWARDTGNSANCISDDQLIITDPNLSYEGEREVVLHEVLHALWAQTTLAKVHEPEAEEAIIWTLAPRLFGFLKDNPEFVKWLLSGK